MMAPGDVHIVHTGMTEVLPGDVHIVHIRMTRVTPGDIYLTSGNLLPVFSVVVVLLLHPPLAWV